MKIRDYAFAIVGVLAVGLTSACSAEPAATAIEVTGSVDTHDPALIIDDAGTDSTKDDVW